MHGETTFESTLDYLVNIISHSPIKSEVEKTEDDTNPEDDKCRYVSLFDNLCSQLFERYRKFLRNTYNDPIKRVSHEWTARDKKSLHLDWIYNVKNYDEWIQPTFDDFRYHFFSNLPFSFYHVLQSTIQYTATQIKILSTTNDDWLHLLVIHDVKIEDRLKSIGKVVLVNLNCIDNKSVTSESLQIRCDGLLPNGATDKLSSPTIIFDDLVESIDICKYDLDQDSYLLTAKLKSQDILLYNLKDFIRKCTQTLLYNEANPTNLPNAVPILQNNDYSKQGLPVKFIFSTRSNSLYPSHVAAIISGSQNITIYPISRVSDSEFKLIRSDVITISPPIGCFFTDLSPTICLEGSQIILYTVDTSSMLNLYQISSGGCIRLALSLNVPEALDYNTLGSHYFHALKLDVNLRFPNLVAVAGVRENIWIYDIVKALGSNLNLTKIRNKGEEHRQGKNVIYHTIIRPYLPNQVYKHYGPMHPIVKLKWIRGAEALLAVQYGKFIKMPEYHEIDAPNHHSVWAIWNVSKNVLSTEDAIMRNKHWIGKSSPPTYSEINSSRLVALYNGHFESLSGTLASDAIWSNKFGLVAASTDIDKQVHVVKPGIWSWGDCDDEFALARLKNDSQFFKKALKHIQKLSTDGASDDGTSTNNVRQRRVCGRFIELEKNAREEFKKMTNGLESPLRLKSLPEWYRKQIVLSTDIDKLVDKIIHG